MNNIKAIEIKHENDRDLGVLTEILLNNDYKLQISPVYETEEQIKSRGHGKYALKNPQINHFTVELVDKVEKPVYFKEEICSECGSRKDRSLF